MPFLFIIVGAVFVIAAVRNTNQELVTLLKGDFTGKGNFIYWTAAILFIGAFGYISELKPVSRAFMALVVIVLFLKNGGVFDKFRQALNQTQGNTVNTGTASASGGIFGGSSIGTSTGNTTGAPFSIPIIHPLG
jgi:hypothetical protein